MSKTLLPAARRCARESRREDLVPPAEPRRARVLVVDDHAVVRHGLKAVLDEEEDFEVFAEAASGSEAVTTALELRPDLILMDLLMPGMSGVDAIDRIRAIDPSVRIVVLTSSVERNELIAAIRAGINGYLLKEGSPEDLICGLREAMRGGTPLAPAVTRRLMTEAASVPVEESSTEPLTARETAVLSVLARGYSNREIGVQLGVTETTIRSHVSRIFSKLGLSNRVQAAIYALRTGLTNLDDC